MCNVVQCSHLTLPASWESCKQDKKQQLELDMEKQTGSKLGKEHVKAVYCHSAYLTYLQSTSCEMLGWMNHKLELRLQEKYQQLQTCRWYHFNGRKWKGTKETLDEGERGEWKSWLQSQHSKTKIIAFSLSTSWQIDGENVEKVTDFTLGGSKITADGDCHHEIKRRLLL